MTRTLHLPPDYGNADLLLAERVAEHFDAEELHVLWIDPHAVVALPRRAVRPAPSAAPDHPLARLLARVRHALSRLWSALSGGPPPPEPAGGEPRRPRAVA